MGRPPYSAMASLPRDFPYGYQPEPKGWAKYLAWESSDHKSDLAVPAAEGRYVQMNKPGIRPCTRETIDSDRHRTFGTFRLRCDGSNHETIVHKCVVLEQSRWLRDRADPSNSHDEGPVRVPEHIRWWQVAWALEYMYEGRVPGFHIWAGEMRSQIFPDRPSRSIVWGLLELWEAGHFFGLKGLTERAEGAFEEYFLFSIKKAVDSHDQALQRGAPEGTASSGTSLFRPEERVAHEFWEATWRIFGTPEKVPRDYFVWHFSKFGRYRHVSVVRGSTNIAVQLWERAMFDTTGTPADGVANMSDKAMSDGPLPHYREAFGPKMTELCSWWSAGGLFELDWFRRLMADEDHLPAFPAEFRTALSEKMGWSDTGWPWPAGEFPEELITFEEVEASSDEELITLEGVEPSSDEELITL